VDKVVGVLGFSFSGSGQNAALAFVPLKDWEERKGPSTRPRPWPAGPSGR
jgi:multidrug efflux pump